MSTLPLASRVAVCRERALAMAPVLLNESTGAVGVAAMVFVISETRRPKV
jgi:hypothetical protein